MQLKYFGFAIIVAVLMSAAAAAHHSHGQYDLTTWTPFEGVVKEVHFLNPHSWIYLEVAGANGAPAATWAMEAAGPGAIEGNGVKRTDVKPGDKIKVRCHLLINGEN